MVSALWKACAADVEDVENVQQLLKEPGVELEAKDQSGTTALIQAVRNGHKEIVKALVAAGADIHHGKPETFTTDSEVLALLHRDSAYDMQHYYYAMPEYPYPYPMPDFPAGDPNGVHNLPPADVARTIPCRYFPVCRYGSSCMFLHPPYFAGPMPPAAPYPPMYPHPYYMMRYPPDTATSPIPFPNGAPPFSSPNGVSAPFPPNGAPFPNGAPYPPAANGAPFSPASSAPYTPGTAGTPSPYGPPPTTPYSAPPFTPGPVPVPYPYPRYDPPKEAPPNGAPNGTGEENQPAPTTNGVNGTGNHPNGFPRRNTRGAGRRESFSTARQQKPACLFFPSGRCRNGDECRFPHVLPEPGSQPSFRYPSSNPRYGHRSRQSVGHHDGPPPTHIPFGTKLPFAPGQPHNPANQQRVPSADDFPVLKSGSASERPPAPSTPSTGLTAAQVLQAPAPAKKGKMDSEVGDLADVLSKVHVNGLSAPAFEAPSTTPEITAVGA